MDHNGAALLLLLLSFIAPADARAGIFVNCEIDDELCFSLVCLSAALSIFWFVPIHKYDSIHAASHSYVGWPWFRVRVCMKRKSLRWILDVAGSAGIWARHCTRRHCIRVTQQFRLESWTFQRDCSSVACVCFFCLGPISFHRRS